MGKVVVIGDNNLDFLKWQQPEQKHEFMTDMVKDRIESLNFVQLIQTVTRTWRGQADSILDHIWTNDPSKVISC